MERDATYARKLGVIATELAAIPEDPAAASSLEKRGVPHAIQVAIDAAMDLAAMRVKDLGLDPSDDYANVTILAEQKIIPAALALDLNRLNGLRNAIVHKYSHFEEEILFDGIDEARGVLDAFARKIEGSG